MISPQQFLTRLKLDVSKHCRLQFGDYVLAHNETDNTMKPRANDAIYLRPSGSASAGFFVYDLTTGRRVHRKSATIAHMTDTVIDKVHGLARSESAPIGLVFGDLQDKSTINDIETNEEPDDDDASDESFHPGVTETSAEWLSDNHEQIATDLDDEFPGSPESNGDTITESEAEDVSQEITEERMHDEDKEDKNEERDQDVEHEIEFHSDGATDGKEDAERSINISHPTASPEY